MAKGVVKFFNTRKGYGFITPEEGEGDVFVHMSAIVAESDEQKILNQYDEVTYEITEGQKGPQASEVVVTKKHLHNLVQLINLEVAAAAVIEAIIIPEVMVEAGAEAVERNMVERDVVERKAVEDIKALKKT